MQDVRITKRVRRGDPSRIMIGERAGRGHLGAHLVVNSTGSAHHPLRFYEWMILDRKRFFAAGRL